MEAKIREHVEGLFVNAPNSRKAYELREEMILNLIEKYHDLIDEGKADEVAYNITIMSIGDITNLIEELEDEPMNKAEFEQHRKTNAKRIVIAVMLYMLSPLPLIILSSLGVPDTIGICLLFLIIAAATGLLIYNSMTKPRYVKADDTVVEEFRQWQSNRDVSGATFKSVSGAIWALTVALYFIISFATNMWGVTWIIFLVAVAVNQIVKAFFDMNRK